MAIEMIQELMHNCIVRKRRKKVVKVVLEDSETHNIISV